jgi:hypothetical protein
VVWSLAVRRRRGNAVGGPPDSPALAVPHEQH